MVSGSPGQTVGEDGLEESGLAASLAPAPQTFLSSPDASTSLICSSPVSSGQAVSDSSPGWVRGY